MATATPLWRRLIRPVLSLLLLALVGLFIARSTHLDDFERAVDRLPMWALWVGYLLGAVNLGIGAFRWGVLMRTFGARTVAPFRELLSATFIAHFYNTFVPGSFGGDLVRGYVTRKSFDQPATGLFVVFFERVVGLLALCFVAGAGLIVGPPIVDYAALAPWFAGVAAVGVLGVGVLLLTGRLSVFRQWLPRIEAPRLLWQAGGISVVGHGISVLSYVVMARAMGLPMDVSGICAVVPLGLLSTILPIAVAGVSAREAMLVGLLGLLGVPPADALIYCLSVVLAGLALAATGGLLQLVQPKVLRYH